MPANNTKYGRLIPFGMFSAHLFLYVFFSFKGTILPFEFFNILLLISSLLTALRLYFKPEEMLLGAGIMLLLASHGLIGHRIAPDALTSGAILLTNILVLYTGLNLFEKLSLKYGLIFSLSYFIFFALFIKGMPNAEPIFLLSLLGLCATARNFRMLSYFYAVVLSFTFCEPYAWEALIFSFLLLKILFSKQVLSAPRIMLLFFICGLLLVFFVLLPVLSMIIEDDPRNIVNILREANVRYSLYLTFITSIASTLILTIFCVPFSYFLARHNFSGKAFLLSLIDLPLVIPQSAAGIALLRVFGKEQFLGEVALNIFGIRFDNTVFGICLAQIFVSMPFIVRSSISAFEALPKNYEQIALTLGASDFQAFYKIAIPMASRGIYSGIIISFARAFGEFGAVLFLAPHPETAPVAVYNRFTSLGMHEAMPLVTTMLSFSVILFFLLQLLTRTFPLIENMDSK